MSALDFVFYALMGICVVFLVLLVLMYFIKILTAITDKLEGVGKPAAPVVAAATSPAAPAKLAPGSAGDLKLYDTDPRDAAMIMAIVADELGKPLNELRFISIREVKK